ncbi:M36 family metallopeptidase [Lapillicoccus jejuensis]|uniref:F5/8 type C domain-containing protein n=1 Tax=Lapillicoccus jejuensis TaxID=402171 RepID=A0A542DXA6_9MICO|nr:M36 family metallopeptidase [Lapillicoccus jejuensis]TQJ07718.1 F5/8 type C domain-containing protein [Lapillicoccus jejuensis]
MARRTTRPSRRLAATTAGAVAVIGLTALPGLAATAPASGPDAAAPSPTAGARGDEKGYYDARQQSGRAGAKAAATASLSAAGKAAGLGSASVDLDPLTLTPRNLTVLQGYLTGPSAAPAADVALGYVRSHLAALGLDQADLATLSSAKDYVDVEGIHHLSWTQSVRGVPVFGNGLKANVAKDGRLISVQGSPVHGLAALAARAGSPALDAPGARAAAAKDVGGSASASATVSGKAASGDTTWSNHDFAKQVWFLTPSGLRRGWSTYVTTGATSAYQHVVDASSGAVLFRRSTVDHDNATAKVYDYYPGAPKGGQPKAVDLVARGWISPSATWLNGKNVVAWADVDDDNLVGKGEKTPGPAAGTTFDLKAFDGAQPGCSAAYVCTWNPRVADSWRKNANADVTNAFYLGNVFHDHLEGAPIGFTPQAGNFQANGGDPVLLNALDGADTADGLPDANHIDNANMSTPPDGTPPTMQMYLWHQPGTTSRQDPFLAVSGAFDASILFHEYTHGLSNRLVVDATGVSTLNSLQAGSMGEAWSDYYALDFLVSQGFITDSAKDGDVQAATYTLGGQGLFRTEAIDCPVGSTAAPCQGPVAGPGGYTYGDLPLIGGAPEVHASGEVWAQTLWDLRTRLGSRLADSLITRAMSLSPADPSMLDMRNAVLQADQVVYGDTHRSTLWKVFANRGMGWFAGSLGSADAQPAQDFNLPPRPQAPRSTVSGTVTDPTTGQPVAGAVVRITGHDSGFSSDYTATTNAAGAYSIGGVLDGTYPKVVVIAPGYETVSTSVTVGSGAPVDFSVRRDWAAASGGGAVTAFNGPDFSTFNCGPTQAIDGSQGTGWGSTTGDDAGTPTNVFVPKFIVVKLPSAVDVETFAVDPSNTCGDPGSSATGAYRIDTSVDGTTWTTAASGTFGTANRGIYNVVTPTAGKAGVAYVKFWILGNQVPDFATNCPSGGFGGCTFTDMTELQVFGKPAA